MEKESLIPEQSDLTRKQALVVLAEGEALLHLEVLAEGMAKMLAAYIALETLDGPEAAGVKELRSWLVKALETLELPEEAAAIRERGTYVDHPLAVMPSTWFATSATGSAGSPEIEDADEMDLEAATAATGRALDLLSEGDVEGLVLLLRSYEALEKLLGPEHTDAVLVRSFLVGLLEAGEFTEEAGVLRRRGSVEPPTTEDHEVYAETWRRILAAGEQGGGLQSGGSEPESEPRSEPEPEPKRRTPPEVGSPVPELLLDFGLGTYRPTIGRKGLIWTLGLQLDWTLFRAGLFSMRLGGGGQFGRNRDQRWQADAFGALGFRLDFERVHITPEFGGGYDTISGGNASPTVAHRVGPGPYYHFGGTLGVRLADSFGLYGRAVRLNRRDSSIPHETRLRAGLLVGLDKTTLDLAFVFTDYEPAEGADGARLFSGNLGLRF